MAELALNAEVRTKTGKNVSRRLRENGMIPAVIYGKNIEPIHCTFALRAIEQALSKARRNAIIKIEFGGKVKEAEVIVRDTQRNVISHHLSHIDFQAIDMVTPIQVEVDISFKGDPVGKKSGAIFTTQLKTVRLECLPAKIPQFIEVDISNLDVGDSLHISDIPKGDYKLITNPKNTICQMSIVKEEVVVAPTVAVEGAEAAPGAVPGAAAPGAVPGAAAPAGSAPAAGAPAAATPTAKHDAKHDSKKESKT